MNKFLALLFAALLVVVSGCSSPVTAPSAAIDSATGTMASAPPPEEEPDICNRWVVISHSSYTITFFTEPLMAPCATPLVSDMRHTPEDPCTFGITIPPGAMVTVYNSPTYNTADCNPPLVLQVD